MRRRSSRSFVIRRRCPLERIDSITREVTRQREVMRTRELQSAPSSLTEARLHQKSLEA